MCCMLHSKLFTWIADVHRDKKCLILNNYCSHNIWLNVELYSCTFLGFELIWSQRILSYFLMQFFLKKNANFKVWRHKTKTACALKIIQFQKISLPSSFYLFAKVSVILFCSCYSNFINTCCHS